MGEQGVQMKIGLIIRNGQLKNFSEERRLLTPEQFRDYVDKSDAFVLEGEAVENAVYERDMRGEHFMTRNFGTSYEAYPIFDDTEAREFFTPSGANHLDPTLSEMTEWYCVIGPKNETKRLGIGGQFFKDPRYEELVKMCPGLSKVDTSYRFGSLHYSELVDTFKVRSSVDKLGTETILCDILDSKEQSNREAWGLDLDKDSR